MIYLYVTSFLFSLSSLSLSVHLMIPSACKLASSFPIWCHANLSIFNQYHVHPGYLISTIHPGFISPQPHLKPAPHHPHSPSLWWTSHWTCTSWQPGILHMHQRLPYFCASQTISLLHVNPKIWPPTWQMQAHSTSPQPENGLLLSTSDSMLLLWSTQFKALPIW